MTENNLNLNKISSGRCRFIKQTINHFSHLELQFVQKIRATDFPRYISATCVIGLKDLCNICSSPHQFKNLVQHCQTVRENGYNE